MNVLIIPFQNLKINKKNVMYFVLIFTTLITNYTIIIYLLVSKHVYY